jgi:hypothetical protein
MIWNELIAYCSKGDRIAPVQCNRKAKHVNRFVLTLP